MANPTPSSTPIAPPCPAVLELDGRGRIQWCNDRMATSFGRTADEARGAVLADLLDPDAAPVTDGDLVASLSAGRPMVISFRNLADPAAVPVTLLVRAERPVRDEAGPRGPSPSGTVPEGAADRGRSVRRHGSARRHDVEAAAFMGQVRTSIRAFASLEPDPGTVLTRKTTCS